MRMDRQVKGKMDRHTDRQTGMNDEGNNRFSWSSEGAFRSSPIPYSLSPFKIRSSPPSSSVEQSSYKKSEARHNPTAHSSSASEMKTRRPEDTIFFNSALFPVRLAFKINLWMTGNKNNP